MLHTWTWTTTQTRNDFWAMTQNDKQYRKNRKRSAHPLPFKSFLIRVQNGNSQKKICFLLTVFGLEADVHITNVFGFFVISFHVNIHSIHFGFILKMK